MRGILVLLTAIGGAGWISIAKAADPVPATLPEPKQVSPIPQSIQSAPMFADPSASYAPNESSWSHPRFREWLAFHRREPAGIPAPVGTGNAWTEFKWVFGSSRQFFGTADSSVGIWNHASVPPPYRDR